MHTYAEETDLKRVAGIRQVVKALKSGKAVSVTLARDAAPMLLTEILSLTESSSVPVKWVDTMKELGKSCALAVGSAAVAEIQD